MCERLEREKRARGRKGYNNNRHDDTHHHCSSFLNFFALAYAFPHTTITDRTVLHVDSAVEEIDSAQRAEEYDTILHSRDED